MIHDKKLLGVCGETELANVKQSLITMMQVTAFLKFYSIGIALMFNLDITNTSSLITWRRLSKVFSDPLPVYLVVSLFTDCERPIRTNPC